MATLTLRQTSPVTGFNKNAPLTNAEVDTNFKNLDADIASRVLREGDTMTGTLVLVEGTSTIAPVKFQAGTNLLTPQNGAAEYDGTDFYLTNGVTRKVVLRNTTGNFVKTITGTANRVIVSNAGAPDATVSLTTPQDIHTGATPTFDKMTLSTSLAVGSGVTPSAVDGRINAKEDVVAYSTSDARLKTNIEHISNALEKVKSLHGVQFTWNPELHDVHGYEGQDTGVIAQDVVQVLPEAVVTRDTGYMAVNYEKMIGLLIEAIKELDTKINSCTCNK